MKNIKGMHYSRRLKQRISLQRKVWKTTAGRGICWHSGSSFGRKVWNSTVEKLRRVIWRCNKKYIVKGCENKYIDDRVLYQAFVNTFNAMIENKDYFIEKLKQNLKSYNLLQRYKAKQFIEITNNLGPIESFDMDLYFKLIEKMTVVEGTRIVVTLLDGTEIECEI